MPKFLKRFSAYGDLAGKALLIGVRSVPWILEPIFLACYAVIYTIVSRPPLRAAQRNLDTIFANAGTKSPFLAQLRLIYQFSATMGEGLRAADDPDCVQWTIEGADALQQLTAENKGAILLTVHMGSYDLAASSFAGKLRRNVNIVRAPERDPETQKLREAQIESDKATIVERFGEDAPQLNVHFNHGEGVLGIDLARALHRNEFVAIQGDRVMFNVAGMTTPCCGSNLKVPKGPFVLAEATKAPIYPFIILRKGWRNYAVRCLAPLDPPTTKDRFARIDERAAHWGATLEKLITQEWNQWFVFEDAFSDSAQPAASEASPAASAS